MSPEFAERLRRAEKIIAREIRDGCLDCRTKRYPCEECAGKIMDMLLEPRKCKALQELLK